MDDADYTAPTPQHGLDHTNQDCRCPERCRSCSRLEIDDLLGGVNPWFVGLLFLFRVNGDP